MIDLKQITEDYLRSLKEELRLAEEKMRDAELAAEHAAAKINGVLELYERVSKEYEKQTTRIVQAESSGQTSTVPPGNQQVRRSAIDSPHAKIAGQETKPGK